MGAAANQELNSQTDKNDFPLPNSNLAALIQETMERGRFFRFRSLGTSMSPFIRDGDQITITSLSNRNPRMGDVIVFLTPENEDLLVHRVIGKEGSKWLAKGDNTGDRDDGLIPIDRILGRVINVNHNGKNLLMGLGPERFLISLLSRYRLLRPLFSLIKYLIPHCQ